jgi:hypothetical protein
MLRQLSCCFSLSQWGLSGWQSRTFDIVSNNVLNCLIWSSQHAYNLTDSDYSVLRTGSSAQSKFSPVTLVVPAKYLASSTEIAPLWVWKNRWSIWHLKVPVEFYPNLQHNMMQTYFLGMSQLYMEQLTLVVNKMLLHNNVCYSLASSRKWHQTVSVCSGSNFQQQLLSVWKLYEHSIWSVCNSSYSQFNGQKVLTADIHCCKTTALPCA